MCGIAGIIGKQALPQARIKACLAALGPLLIHRGPDDHGEHIGKNHGCIHRRLSIVDISGGHQPIYNEDRSIGLVYNGEIYNYTALRDDLKNRGYQFHTNTDTEVILRGYEEYGTAFLKELNGMFAFCLWDDRTDVIYLARDCFGIKPLYVYEDAEQIIFSSELKGILGLPGVDLSLDAAGIQDYLTFRYVQAPFTFFGKIRKLESGTYLEIKRGRSAQFRYWDVSYTDPYPRPALKEVQQELSDLLLSAVKSQLMGEVPIGVLLSGGIDSSAIACLIHSCGAHLKTFNIGFPDINEFEFSRAVAREYGLEHIEIITTPEELMNSVDSVVRALDEPIADPACFPLYILAREIKKHVTVVLSGEGGDELFGGYLQYRHLVEAGVPYSKRFDEFMRRSWYFPNSNDFLNNGFMPDHTPRFKKYFEDYPLLNGMLAYDMKTWVPENLMMKADKILMAHSLEGRFPFLDKKLFEFAASLPQDYKIASEGTQKWLLKTALKSRIPEVIIKRPKMGFTVPVQGMMKTFKPLVMDVLETLNTSSLTEVINLRYARKFIESYYRKENDAHLQVWTLFIMCYWFATAFPGSAKR
ncbi:MAG: asparagine synthase (glutamine-hydrolyzing) [Thermodesulfovibrio sp.]|nr:asparagine synthase (glutamine-hydrolyzing) [Thermodesulfovibrio sp.]